MVRPGRASPPGWRGNEAELTYDQACDLVIRTFSEFSPDFGEFARMGARDRLVGGRKPAGEEAGRSARDPDAQRNAGLHDLHGDGGQHVDARASKLGHAYHSYVLRNEPLLLQDYPMNLAETASTFAEAVLNDAASCRGEVARKPRLRCSTICSGTRWRS